MKVMAHRGYSGAYPENTMLSFREAVKVGCDAIEMDVHETRDGRLVVIHDERLDRTTDGTGRICDHTFDELQQFNAAKRFEGKYAPERIPSFDEYCEWASGERVGHNIEIKTDKIYYHDIERKIWATIERYGLEHKVMFSSFNHFSLRRILEVLERYGVNVEYLPSGIDNVSLVVSAEKAAPCMYQLLGELQKEIKPDAIHVTENIAIVAAVGRKMAYQPGSSGKIFATLGENGINIRMITQGPEELNIIVGVDDADFAPAIRVLYDSFVK